MSFVSRHHRSEMPPHKNLWVFLLLSFYLLLKFKCGLIGRNVFLLLLLTGNQTVTVQLRVGT